MKKVLVLAVLLLVASVFIVFNVYGDTDVYKDDWSPVAVLSLWSGDAPGPDPQILVLSTATVTSMGVPVDGKCIRFSFPKEISWSKIGIESYGGAVPLDLTGHTKMQFKVCANQENVIAHFGMGSGGLDKDSSGEHKIGGDPVAISKTAWTNTDVDLAGQNMTKITTLWWMMLAAGENSSLTNPIEVYVDDIKYAGGGAGIITVTVTGGTIGVSVSGTIAFGSIAYGDTKISSENISGDKYFTVANIGDVNEDFYLKVLDPPGWVSGDAPGLNKYVLYAVISNKTVPYGDIGIADFGAEDIVTIAPQKCGSSGASGKFDSDDEGNGINVSWNPVYNNVRAAWIMFKAPISGSITAQQTLRVVIIAEKS